MRKKSSIPGKINNSKIKGQGARTEGNILSENLDVTSPSLHFRVQVYSGVRTQGGE